MKWVQLALSLCLASITLRMVLILYILFHCIPTDSQLPGYLPLAQSLPLHYMYVQNGLLFSMTPPRFY
jgi:hypothetical protein